MKNKIKMKTVVFLLFSLLPLIGSISLVGATVAIKQIGLFNTIIPIRFGPLYSNLSGCQIDPFIQDLAPIVLLPNSSEFIYPVYGDTTLKINENNELDFVCPGGTVVIENVQSNSDVLRGTCLKNSTFTIDGKNVEWRQIKCSQNPTNSAKYTGRSCSGVKEAEIGFSLTDGRFLKTIQICFDDKTQNTITSSYNLTSAIGQKKHGTPRPKFKQGTEFYHVGSTDVNTLYSRPTQTKTINALLGLEETNTTYIKGTGDYFLSRGHLTARGDFFYPCQESATFYYINAAPQWQTFNGGNWNTAENNVLDYAATNGVNLQVWTGTYGVTTLPHSKTGSEIPLYLYTNSTTYGIPLPQLYWKVVYNPMNKTGVALLGVNNPYQSEFKENDVICADQSDLLTWMTWEKNSTKLGLSYACSIPDFQKVVTVLPKLNVTGMLL